MVPKLQITPDGCDNATEILEIFRVMTVWLKYLTIIPVYSWIAS